jgi:hypothetical protein
VQLPVGQHGFYTGPQDAPYNWTDEHIAEEARFASVEPFGRGSHAYLGYRNAPYLGRWMWPEFQTRASNNLNSSSFAGLAHIWVSYGASPHDERGFTSFMTEPNQRGYSSFVAYGGVDTADLLEGKAPRIAPGAIQKGDRVLAQTASGLGDFTSFEGVILDAEPSILPSHDWAELDPANEPSYAVLCVGRGYSADEDYRQQHGVQPNSFLSGPWSAQSLSYSTSVGWPPLVVASI